MLLLQASAIYDPLYWWEFLTYGFVHDPSSLWHIGGNMLVLIMFGYGLMIGVGPGGFGLVRSDSVEEKIGRTEYFVFYLATIIVGGVVFSLMNLGDVAAAMGASGGVTGVAILYAWLFPNKKLYLYGILPMPMWGLGVLIVAMDMMGASGKSLSGIAYGIHLTGAAFATFYYFCFLKRGIKLTDNYYIHLRNTRQSKQSKTRQHKPNLRVYTENDKADNNEAGFNRRLDEILGRYGQVGEAGLTQEERAFLQQASKKYRDKHQR
ncbi:rhomboid family intramembrane serine protease [Planctomycetales bacterium]|nr:rhomboid family intramembrane serine protease [Planctomycetales bacterium]